MAESSPVYFVTCSEPDATPFLTALPDVVQERAVLVATGDVVRAAERRTRIPDTFVLGGPSTHDEARRLLAARGAHVTVVVAPDPWGPIHGKGFARARLTAPYVLPETPVDVVTLRAGGESGSIWRGVDRVTFARWIRRREAALLLRYLLWRPIESRAGSETTPLTPLFRVVRIPLIPLRVAATLVIVLPYVLAGEARARKSGRGA
jgi:hypothetical protein